MTSTVTMEGHVDENSHIQLNKDGNVVSTTSESLHLQDRSTADARSVGVLLKVKQSLSLLLGYL